MNPVRKIIGVILGIAAFALTTTVFLQIVDDMLQIREESWESRGTADYHLYATAETESTEVATEPAEAKTEPTVMVEETVPPETALEETVPQIVYDTVPKYFQTDYPDILFGSGTMATSGSSITSLAMVASYLTGQEYLPDELAGYFADFIGNNMQLLEHASDTLQLPWEKAANIDVAVQALREGKIVIALMKEHSIFMESQHFVVFTGWSEDGKILINDPYEPNYSQWNLQNALVNGFQRSDLSGGYGGAWIYDPGAMPEEPFIYTEATGNIEPRYPGIELSQEDKDLLARLIWGEAQGEPFEGQQAVAEVILNRMAADNFPDTVRGVLYAEGQFSSVNNLYLAELTHTQYEAIERALYGPYVLPADVVFFATYPVNDNVWGKIGSHTFCYQW